MAIKPVEQWTLEDATSRASGELPKDYESSRKLIEDHDHWQNGTLWPGHRTGDAVTDAALLKNVEPQFVPDDVLSELVDNRTNGLLGQEADVALVPVEPAEEGTPAEQAQQEEIDEVLEALARWWDCKRFWERVTEAVDRVHFAGRASLRAFVAEGNLGVIEVTTGEATTRRPALPAAEDLATALDYVEVDAPPATLAIRYTDPLTQRPVGVVVTKDTQDRDRAEVWTHNRATDETELRLLGSGEPGRAQNGVMPPTLRLRLGGRLPVTEARGRRIVTGPLKRLQTLLNFITTVTGRTVETAGFRERYVGNVEPPGMWLPYKPQSGPPLAVDDTDPAQTYYKHRVPWVLGASITTELIGLRTTITKPDGTQGEEYATPTVESLDPVDPAYATAASDAITGRMYKRAKQGHLSNVSTAEASGVAYEQARAQFLADLLRLKGAVEGMIRDLIEVALAYAGLMHAESAGLLERYRVQVNLKVSAGPITADEQRLAVELRDKRAISQATAQTRLGVDDTAAENTAIDADPMMRAQFWATMGQALMALTALQGTAMTAEGAGWLLGLTAEQVEVLRTGLPPGQTPTPDQRAAMDEQLGVNDEEEEPVAA